MGSPAVLRDTGNIITADRDTPARGQICWQTLLTAGVTQTNSLIYGVATLEPGDDFALHHHPEAEVYFGVEGETVVTVDGQPCRLAPGISIFIPSNTLHGIAAVSGRVTYFYVLAADAIGDPARIVLPPVRAIH